MNSRNLVFAFLFAVLLASLFPFLGEATGADATGIRGGDLVVALRDFGNLDPRDALSEDRKVLELVYDSLGRIDPLTLQFVPWAATGWLHDGGKNIIVTLRDDLRFADGIPYDADAVVRSLSTYTKSGVQRWNAVKVDELTLRLDFSGIDDSWDYRTSPAAGPGLFYTEGLSALIAWDASGVRRYSGPYRVEREDAVPLKIVPSEHHFSGRPNLDSITYRWPYTVDLDPNGRSHPNDAGCALLFRVVHLIGWNLQANEMTAPRDCVAGYGGFQDDPTTPSLNESLRSILNPNQNLTMSHVSGAKNPGTDLLYYGFTYNIGSAFVGSPGTQGQKLRSAVYTFANKPTYRLFESQSVIAHGPQNQFNTPWSPASCGPWSPCNTIVEAATVRAPPPVNQRTNTDPGIQALNEAGIFDRDGNGWRETASGVEVAISILAPSFSLDTQKKAMADDLRTLAISAQLNASVETFDSWADLDAAAASCTSSCMYIRRYTSATQLPDWIYDVPEVRSANDPVVDALLNEGAAATFTQANRSLRVGYVSRFLGAAADFLPLLHFDALEGYDAQKFTGWVNTFGGINNFWSFVGLHLPSLGGLHVRASVFPIGLRPDAAGVTRGLVSVEVRDDVGRLLEGVDLQLSSGLPGALERTTGRTDEQGSFATNYTTTGVSFVSNDVVWVNATKRQYAGDRASASLTAHPPLSKALRVGINRGPKVEIEWNETARIVVSVQDSARNLIEGAEVVLRTDLPAGSFAKPNGTTDANGTFVTTFFANATQGMTIQIVAEVSAVGYDSAVDTEPLAVRGSTRVVEEIPRMRNVSGLEVSATIGSIAVAFILVAMLRRRRKD